MSVIILLAVGSDYNLLLVSRFKEERDAGLNTGIIRAIAGSGSVVTSAGLVFAFTMMSFAISDLKVMAQVGTTIGLGLLVDTLVIRSFMTPSIAALLGRWFWWPQNVQDSTLPPASSGGSGRVERAAEFVSRCQVQQSRRLSQAAGQKRQTLAVRAPTVHQRGARSPATLR